MHAIALYHRFLDSDQAGAHAGQRAMNLGDLAQYMIQHEYFDDCPVFDSESNADGSAFKYEHYAQCFQFNTPAEVLLSLSPLELVRDADSATVMDEFTCESIVRGDKVVFIKDKTTGFLKLAVDCESQDGDVRVAVLNTRGKETPDVLPSERWSDIIAFSVVTESAISPLYKGSSPVIPKQYPLYRQCDKRWANRVMGKNGETICQVGCLMSSTAMALYGHGIPLPNGTAMNPAMFNYWLRKNGGYTEGSAFIQTVMPNLCAQQSSRTKPCVSNWPTDGMHRSNDLSLATIQGYLNRARVVIANVNAGRHFVLVTGWDKNNNDTLYVNDPGAGRPSFSYKKDVVGWRIFDFKGPKTKSINQLAAEWAAENLLKP